MEMQSLVSVAAARLGAMVTIDSWESLTREIRSGASVEYLHFWGHRPRPDGTVGAGCLSQWWPSPFRVGGVEYATAEHWMMAAKARLFGDAEAEERVLAPSSPAAAKKAGRLVRGFDEAIWARERFAIVVEGSVQKFSAHADLRESCWPRGTGCSSRPVPWTGYGASDWPRTTSGPGIRSAGAD
ncbi:hypothetical protein STSP_18320 [Streptomyces jeddahensis]|uniref:NADAR domain-containing protein n=1 Tax=Streptomyces jeddahensis TaxID=1716141 RepID=A0A177HV23_9ACTN|nr:hypothetical protein STSP_18320 [Streptomyces jeddahensis]